MAKVKAPTPTRRSALNAMRAVVCTGYGSPDEVLEVRDVDAPVPRDDEVQVRVRAAAANPLDWRLMSGEPRVARLALGLRAPNLTRPGRDLAGRVEAVGANVTRFRPGDDVFGTAPGAFAEVACAAESALARKPSNVTYEQAAAVPVAGLTALQGLRDAGRIRAGQRVLINGAAGGVGTFAVQVAKALGATVTGVCSTRNVEMVRAIGADHVIDYTREEFVRGAERYDMLFDLVGNRSLAACRRILAPGGIFVLAGGPKDVGKILRRVLGALLWRLVSRNVSFFVTRRSAQDLEFLGKLVAAGTVTPVLERSYRLEEAGEALRHLAEGHARGKVVLIP
jgi:NADPH:quinone reductase-like Zn-dependent oxidoreductase